MVNIKLESVYRCLKCDNMGTAPCYDLTVIDGMIVCARCEEPITSDLAIVDCYKGDY